MCCVDDDLIRNLGRVLSTKDEIFSPKRHCMVKWMVEIEGQ